MTVPPVPDYSSLREQIVLSVGKSVKHGQIVEAVKEFYKDEIDSPRRYEQVKTIGQLLTILEIRNVLSEDDVGCLKEIARKLHNNHRLLTKINEYETFKSKKGYPNSYAPQQGQNSPQTQYTTNTPKNNPYNNESERKREIITEAVVEEIGSYWRDLARNLGIKESIIDEIESSNNLTPTKASMMMEVYYKKINNTDAQRWFFILCDALERTRRKDLSKLLQRIMMCT